MDPATSQNFIRWWRLAQLAPVATTFAYAIFFHAEIIYLFVRGNKHPELHQETPRALFSKFHAGVIGILFAIYFRTALKHTDRLVLESPERSRIRDRKVVVWVATFFRSVFVVVYWKLGVTYAPAEDPLPYVSCVLGILAAASHVMAIYFSLVKYFGPDQRDDIYSNEFEEAQLLVEAVV